MAVSKVLCLAAEMVADWVVQMDAPMVVLKVTKFSDVKDLWWVDVMAASMGVLSAVDWVHRLDAN